jgi:hypothetical protein
MYIRVCRLMASQARVLLFIHPYLHTHLYYGYIYGVVTNCTLKCNFLWPHKNPFEFSMYRESFVQAQQVDVGKRIWKEIDVIHHRSSWIPKTSPSSRILSNIFWPIWKSNDRAQKKIHIMDKPSLEPGFWRAQYPEQHFRIDFLLPTMSSMSKN